MKFVKPVKFIKAIKFKSAKRFTSLFAFLALFCFFAVALAPTVYASESYWKNEEAIALPTEEWEGFVESIPDELEEYLPEGALDSEERYAEAVGEISSPKYIATALLELFGVELSLSCRLLVIILGALLISSALSAIGGQSKNQSFRAVMRFCSLGALFCSVGYAFYSDFERIELFFERIAFFVNGMIPVTASLWALGGNISTASAGSATLYCILTVLEKLWASSAIPIFALLISLGFCDVLCSELQTGRIVSAIKKIYGFFLGISMTVLLSSLAAQTTLAAVADSVSARTGRLVSSTVIPIVGGNLGEALRTVASSVVYLKSIFGIGGIAIIALLTLPTAISLLLTRFVFNISSALADIIGCREEARLLNAFYEAYGCMLAVVSGVGMMFVLSFCIFMKTAVAAAL